MTATITAPPGNEFIVSFFTLRKAIGVIGLLLSIVVRVGAYLTQDIGLAGSLSAYYYTGMRDVLVGTLGAIGVFLFFYRGRDRADDILTNLAGLAAIGIGLLPMDPHYDAVIQKKFPEAAGPLCPHGPVGAHIVAVAAFFALTAYITIFQFTKATQPVTPRKRTRNAVYIACGLVMIGSFLVIALQKYVAPQTSIFGAETVAIAAFSIAWLTKGQAILKDTGAEPPRGALQAV